MNQKQLIWLLGALVVLLGLAYFTGAFTRDASTVDVPALSIPADAVETVRIRQPGAALALQRTGDRWQLTAPVEAAADSAAVRRFLQDLGDLRLAAVVSRNPAHYGAYGVDSTAATHVAVAWPGGTRTLTVGNQGLDFQSVYLRLDDDPRVYVSKSRFDVPTNPDRWRDKTVLEVAGVTTAAAYGPDRTFEVGRDGEGWQVVLDGAAAPADADAVARWFQGFAPLKADGFLDDVPAATVRDSATHRVVFTTAGGTGETLWLQRRADDVAAATTGGGTTYLLRAYRLDTLVPDPASLRIEDSR